MLFRNVKGMAATSTVPQQHKRSAPKIQVSCPDIIKLHNKGKRGVNLTDKKALKLIIWIEN